MNRATIARRNDCSVAISKACSALVEPAQSVLLELEHERTERHCEKLRGGALVTARCIECGGHASLLELANLVREWTKLRRRRWFLDDDLGTRRVCARAWLEVLWL